MFNQARLRLTVWYLGIVMVITLMFSLIIYRATTFELDRMAERQRNKWERQITPFFEPKIDEEILSEIRRRIVSNLGVINLIIWAITGGVGYYLAGKTLQPIAENMEAQAQFISDASHELKTPITAMRTAIEVNLREKDLANIDTRKLLSENLNEVIRLQRLAEGLLELSSKKKVVMDKIELSEIVEEAKQNVEPIAAAKDIKLAVEGKFEQRLMGSAEDLSRALIIILDNAIKYSHKKGVVRVEGKTKGKEIIIRVVDQGIGIANEDLPHVMERFYRAEKSRTTNGYGLGLAIARKIVEQHGGNIHITSKLGKGTAVAIALPYSAKIQPKA